MARVCIIAFPAYVRRVVMLPGALAAATPAKADHWQLCMNNLPDRVLEPCSAVIEHGGCEPVELARAHVRRGEWSRQHNRFDGAWADLAQAGQPDPNNYNAVAGHSPLLTQKGEIQKAMAYCERFADLKSATSLDPNNVCAYVARGSVYRAKAQHDLALAEYDRAIATNPGHASAHAGRGATPMSKGQVDDALVEFDRALAADPKSDEARAGLGATLLGKARVTEALVEFDRALEINPAGAVLGRASALPAGGQAARAVVAIDNYLSKDSTNAVAVWLHGTAMLAKAAAKRRADELTKRQENRI